MDDGLPQAAEDITVIIEDGPDDSVRTSPDGTTEIDLPDGGVVVQFGGSASKAGSAPADLKNFYENLASKIGDSDNKLSLIAEELLEQIQADDNSRKGTLENQQKGLTLLGLQLEEPKSGVGDTASSQDGMSVVTNPLLLDACLRSWANSNAELLPADGPCKIENEADEATEQVDELADMFQRDMNYYLTDIASEYYPDTSHMLLWGNTFGGCGIKKVFIDPQLRRPSSQSVAIKDLIVSDTTKDLKTCERITHQITMRPSVLKRLQMKGYYRDFPLAPATQPEPNAVDQKIAGIQGTTVNPETRPEDTPYTLYETQCELNLPEFAPKEFAERNIPLPFLVTIEKDSRTILALRRDWKPEDEDCQRKQMYVKYPYVPGPGFYGTGLLNILGNASAAMTAAWRLSLDAEMYATFPGGLVSELGARQKSMTLRPMPGEFTPIQTNNRPIADVIMANPYKGASPQMITLMSAITEQAKSVGGAIEIPVKEGVKDIPVGTMLAYVEQAAQVMLAAHKGMHTAQSEELTLIVDLFREDPESFWRGNKKGKKFWNEEKLFEALETYSLVPKSDPNVPSHVHRLMKAVALIQLMEVPGFAPRLSIDEILRRVLRALKEDPNGLVVAPPPPSTQPTPDMIEAEAKMKKEENAEKKIQVDALTAAQKGEVDHNQQAADIEGKRIDLVKAVIQHAGERHDAGHQQLMDHKKHGLDQAGHALDVVKTLHEMDQAGQESQRKDRAQAVDETTALNPPAPQGNT